MKRRNIKPLLKIGVITIVIDSIVTALPAAVSLSQGDEYLPPHEQGAILNFIKGIGFYGILYLIMVSPLHIIMMLLYHVSVKNSKLTAIVHILSGLAFALTIYLIYAHRYSLDWNREYFPLRVIWYSLLGASFGWLYHKYVQNHTLT